MADGEKGKARPHGEWDWFRVTFDDQEVTLDVTPRNREPWRQSFAWSSVVRVCFKPEYPISDGLYIFVRERPESYVVPVECCVGGAELLNQLIYRGLFAAEVAIEAASATQGIYCWPRLDREANRTAGREAVRTLMERREVPVIPGRPLDKDSLTAYLLERFPDREHSRTEWVEELLRELLGGGARTVEEVDAIVAVAQDALAHREADAIAKGHSRFADVGVVRFSVRVFDFAFYLASKNDDFWMQEQMEESDAREYAPYRRWTRPM